MRVLVENSTWNNIGDGFYQSSVENIFRRLHGDGVVSVMDGPIGRAFRPKNRGQNAFQLNEWQDADLYVFSGPILNDEFLPTYAKIIENLTTKGAKYCLISVNGNGYSLERNREFLRTYPPTAFSSRDEPTFEMYSASCPYSLNGVCAAALVSETCTVADLTPSSPYVTVSFYERREPILEIVKGEVRVASERPDQKDSWWRIKRHLQHLRSSQESVGDYLIIRPLHDIAYKFPHLNFASSNSFLSYHPMSYLSLYKHTHMTLTNRVHAALPTLSYGNATRYFGKTNRDGVFGRLGLDANSDKPMRLERPTVVEELEKLVDFLKGMSF